MTLPRFTADRALARTRGRYRGTPRHATHATGLVAAQMAEIDATETNGDDDDMNGSEEDTVFEFDDDA